MLLYLIYALYHKVACKRLISIEILLFDVLALLKYCWKQVTLTNVIWNDRTFHASVLLVEDPETLRFFLFGDEVKLYREIKSPYDSWLLHSDTNNIRVWCISNYMKLNINKGRVVFFFQKNELAWFWLQTMWIFYHTHGLHQGSGSAYRFKTSFSPTGR